jgi:hypothetical protein
MSYLVTCGHCSRSFLPSSSIHLCRDCAPACDRLEADCASQPDPAAALAEAKSRLRGMKRHRDLKPPEDFAELLPWLLFHPYVRITGPSEFSGIPLSRDEAFLEYREGSLWFLGDEGRTFIPISCTRTEAAMQSETGISFDPSGFTVYKFGCHIRVEYQ